MAVSWVAGSAMGAIAGVLITPRINFDPISLTLVVIDAFTAALIGRLTSLPWTVVGAMFLGLAETYPRIFSSNAGAGNAVTFALVLLTLAILFRPGTRLVQRMRAILHFIKLGDCADTPAGDLPVGLQRRLEIGRALCLEPRLLLLDEPGAGLDARETARRCWRGSTAPGSGWRSSRWSRWA
jgi:branched-chain amino acid transport system permease protein